MGKLVDRAELVAATTDKNVGKVSLFQLYIVFEVKMMNV